MSNVLNKTTGEYRVSVHDPDFPSAQWFINPNVSAVVSVPTKYWKVGTNPVQEMSTGEKSAVDAAEVAAALAANKAGATSETDNRLVLVALVKVLIDELNVIRTWTRDFKTQVAAATTLADLKTRVATLSTLNDRTGAQARTAIKAEINA